MNIKSGIKLLLSAALFAAVFWPVSPAISEEIPYIDRQIPRVYEGWGGGVTYYPQDASGRIYEVVPNRGSTIYIKDQWSGDIVGTMNTPYPDGAQDITYDSKRDLFWLSLYGNALVAIRPTDGTPVDGPYKPTPYMLGVFYDQELDCLWISNQVHGLIVRFDLETKQVVETIQINHGLGSHYDGPTGVVRAGDFFWFGTESDSSYLPGWMIEARRDGTLTGRKLQFPPFDAKWNNFVGGMDLDPEGYVWVKCSKDQAIFRVNIGYTPPTEAAGELNWYLPAGGTKVEDTDFDTFILVANPGNTDANIEITYVGTDQVFGSVNRTVPAGTRYTENMKNSAPVGAGRKNVAAIVRSTNDVLIIVERTMYFPAGGSQSWIGSHNTIGLSTTGTNWFLAEGATHAFDQFVHVLNPGTLDSNVTVTFFNQTGQVGQVSKTLGGNRVWTVDAEAVVGSQPQLSTRVTASLPVAVDRTMYWPKGDSNSWQDGHATIGVLDFANEWYLPEGATHIFNEYVLVANPSETQTANVNFTFSDQGGGLWTHQADIPAQRRYTVNVNQIVGDVTQVSTKVTSNIPVVAERAMYWPKGAGASGWIGGHDTVGVSSAHRRWELPEGATHIFDEYVLVANPSQTQTANVNFTFRDQTGATWIHNMNVQPQRRYTVKVNNVVGSVAQIWTTVEANIPVVAERAMYLPQGGPWKTGHVTVGVGGK